MQQTDNLPEILRHVVLTYSAVIDRSRKAIGTRIMAISTSGQNMGVSEVIRALSGSLPSRAEFSMLAPFGLKYDADLLTIDLPRNMVVEVPHLALSDPNFKALLPSLAERGLRLAIRGRGDTPLDEDLLSLFEYAIIGVNEARHPKAPNGFCAS
jgi:hypothetical protein